MKSPAEALAAARARRASAPASAEAGPLEGAEPVADPRQVSLRRLTEWAVIEPREDEVYSTRRWGAPITALKRVLIRLLRQYLFQISGQQTRFNVYALGELMALQERVRALEASQEGSGGDGPGSSGDVAPRGGGVAPASSADVAPRGGGDGPRSSGDQPPHGDPAGR